ncbi:MAG TPA: sulfatase [Opitutaceae bacterium]|nr:sulfatase [Opitutaceae bacterium]
MPSTLSRREFVQSAVALAGTTLLPAAAHATAQPAGKRPNLVFFLAEAQRADALSLAGHPILQTPNQDRIGREGIRFTNAFCTNALCAPARAATLTGMYSRSTGALANEDAHRPLPADIPFFTDLLHEAGYDVAIVGKTHVRNGAEDRYWDYYFGHNAAANNYWNPIYKEGSAGRIGPARQYQGVWADELAVERALQWLERRRDRSRPFCLLVWFMAPHAPFYRPRRYLDLYNGTPIPKPATFDDDLRGYPGKPKSFAEATNKIGTTVFSDTCRSLEEVVKDYYAGLKGVDDLTGRIIGYLERERILDETAILQGSDHGYFLGEWRCYDKRLMHEPSIHVPLMIRYPRRIRPGTVRSEMALDLDIAPTLLDLAGIAIPAHLQGRSLLPLADAPNPDFRREWYYEYFEWPNPESVRPCQGIRTERHKLIRYVTHSEKFADPQEFELYDLQADPGERDNLWGRPGYAALQQELLSRLDALRQAVPVAKTA